MANKWNTQNCDGGDLELGTSQKDLDSRKPAVENKPKRAVIAAVAFGGFACILVGAILLCCSAESHSSTSGGSSLVNKIMISWNKVWRGTCKTPAYDKLEDESVIQELWRYMSEFSKAAEISEGLRNRLVELRKAKAAWRAQYWAERRKAEERNARTEKKKGDWSLSWAKDENSPYRDGLKAKYTSALIDATKMVAEEKINHEARSGNIYDPEDHIAKCIALLEDIANRTVAKEDERCKEVFFSDGCVELVQHKLNSSSLNKFEFFSENCSSSSLIIGILDKILTRCEEGKAAPAKTKAARQQGMVALSS